MNEPRRIRWKSFLVVAALIAGGWILVLSSTSLDEAGTQRSFVIICCLLLLLWIPIWVLLVSGMRWKSRGLAAMGLAGIGAAVIFLVRIDGFEGDILPQFAWRWEPKPGEGYDELELEETAWKQEVPGAVDALAFLGADGGNLVPDSALPARWYEGAPRERWRRNVGLGWSAFAVARGLAITQEQRDDEECIVAYALDDGAAVWTHANLARFSEALGGDGPRATPTIAGERVLALGATGILDCVALETGELNWSHDTLTEAGHGNLDWGKSTSPVVVGDLVIVPLGRGAGGTLAAFDLVTGEPRWRAGDFESSYATPVLRTLGGIEQLVVVYAEHLAGHRLEDGAVLWSTPIPRAAANVANAVVLPPDRVFVSLGYGKGARAFTVTPGPDGSWRVEPRWRSQGMKAKFTNLVMHGEHAYGLDEGRLACFDAATGRRVWKGTRWGHGQLLGVGEHLLVQAESGEVVIVEASTEGEKVVLRFDALDSKTWNQPVLAGRHLLVRNDREAICFTFGDS